MVILSQQVTRLQATARLITAIVAINLIATVCLISAQATDGDEQFSAYHQDIGRISGGQTGGGSVSAVAPSTVIRQASPSPSESHERGSAQPAGRVRQSASRSRQSSQQVVNRTPNQLVTSRSRATTANTLVDQPITSAHTESSSFSQLVAPPRIQQQQLRAPTSTTIQSSFQPLLAASQSEQDQGSYLQQPPQRPQGASLSSRHSALMAQVAAERQAAAEAAEQASLNGLGHTPLVDAAPPHLQSDSGEQQTPSGSQFQHQQAAASPALSFVNQPEEPLVAPSFEHVLSSGCPHKGLFSYPNKEHCDRYYMCTNGTFTEEACPNGLAYSQMGAVYQHCAYQWNVDCERKKTSQPISSPGCPWQFGIFPIEAAGKCSIDYFVCEWGVPETKRCTPEGLFYDERIKGCQWADQLGCKSEALLNFKCPPEDEDNPYWPYPRYYHTKQDVIVCVNEQPRLVHCNEDQMVEPSSLACIDLKKKKKIMKF